MKQAQQFPTENNPPIIHRAPWVVVDPAGRVSSETTGIIDDGAVLLADGRIMAVGKAREMVSEYPGYPVIDHEGRALVPGLINGHCHLELSYMPLADTDERRSDYAADPTEWIRDLLKARESFQRNEDAGEILLAAARQVLDRMADEGIVYVGDIGNALASREIGLDHRTQVSFLLEFLGLSKESEIQSIARLARVYSDEALDLSCTAHAPYSTTPNLIRKLKRMADSRDRIFSIHVAESPQEVEFLRGGSGKFLDFLRERGAWDNSFAVPGCGPVHYLERLDVLNRKTLCVHAVHLDPEEIAILASRKAKVCICPGSNRFLGVGKAPVTEFLDRGILPALGTDSRASNGVLSIWREMRLLRQDHPGVAPAAVFGMATLGGAKAWGIDSLLGSLAKGRLGRIVSVDCRSAVNSGPDLYEYLTTAGESVATEWVQ